MIEMGIDVSYRGKQESYRASHNAGQGGHGRSRFRACHTFPFRSFSL